MTTALPDSLLGTDPTFCHEQLTDYVIKLSPTSSVRYAIISLNLPRDYLLLRMPRIHASQYLPPSEENTGIFPSFFPSKIKQSSKRAYNPHNNNNNFSSSLFDLHSFFPTMFWLFSNHVIV